MPMTGFEPWISGVRIVVWLEQFGIHLYLTTPASVNDLKYSTKGGSPGLVVIGEESRSEGRGF